MAAGVSLADRIRAKMDLGFLPIDSPDKVYTHHGRGRGCDGCDQSIVAAQVEFELPYPSERTVRFHQGCYGLWEAERRRRGRVKDRR